ncbi:ferrochelatase [Litoribrevibacter euphylliae]|uniref:Ferrochelatase n=1 Tax=Litoribrevibacter euphylliae TaxID=1834034 RepID=A0ABV7HQB6_9GAMM
MSKKVGVLLINLGTPEQPTAQSVRQFLAEFLSDRRVVDIPKVLWMIILHGVILRIRPKKVAKLYQSIWFDDGSPLMHYSRKQQQALQQALADQDIPVELAMTYGKPSMTDAGKSLAKQGVEHIIVLPLYPQNSRTSTAAAFDSLARSLGKCPHVPGLTWVSDYHDHPGYIAALAQSVEQYWQQYGKGDHLLMSFHGIPQRLERIGDPYPKQCRTTAKLLAEKLGLEDHQWQKAFQSRFGREEWVKPYTDETLEDWGKKGMGRVDVIAPSFSVDCLETLEEIQIQNQEIYLEAGGKDYHYIPALNAEPDHIEFLASLVKEYLPAK